MTELQDDSRLESRGKEMRAIPSRAAQTRLTPERAAEIRLRILEQAYDSPEVADVVARRMLRLGDV